MLLLPDKNSCQIIKHQHEMMAREFTPTEIAETLQFYRTTKLAIDNAMHGMSSKRAKDMLFPELHLKLCEPSVITTVKKILDRICTLTVDGFRICPGSVSNKDVKIRVFLASFMTAHHPDNVFEIMNTRENELVKRSRALVKVWDKITTAIISSKNIVDVTNAAAASIQFQGLVFYYLKAFTEWKLPDELKLSARITHAIVALFEAENHIIDEDDGSEVLRKDMRSQMNRLCGKLVKIGGEKALTTLNAKIATYPKSVTLTHVKDETGEEGGVVSTSGYSTLPKRMTNEQLAQELLLDPNFKLDEHGGCGGENPVHTKIRNSFHKAFWKSLADDLRLDPPLYVRVEGVFHEIQDGIADMQTGAGSFKGIARIQDVLELADIQQQMKHNAFSWSDFIKVVNSVEALLNEIKAAVTTRKKPEASNNDCKVTEFKRKFESDPTDTARPSKLPVQEAEPIKWHTVQDAMTMASSDISKKPAALCDALCFILDETKRVRIDMANSRLQWVLPVIYRHGFTYQRDHFHKKITAGLLLTNVQKRLRSAICYWCNVRKSIKFTDLTSNDANNAKHFKTIVDTMVTGLVIGKTPITDKTFPETLLLDLDRLRKMHDSLNNYSSIAMIIVMVGQELSNIKDLNRDKIIDDIITRLITMERCTDRVDKI